MTKLMTYHNDPEVKARLLGELAEDEAADRFVRGTYGNGEGDQFRGCSVGCQTRRYLRLVAKAGSRHKAYELILGWPEWLALLEEYLFENVEPSRASRLSREIADAMPVGLSRADTDKLRHRFLAWILRNALAYDREKDPGVAKVVDKIAVMHEDAASRKSAAWSAASSAAWSASESAAESAAVAAARSAAWSAAWFASESAFESAFESAAADKIADALISMLKDMGAKA